VYPSCWGILMLQRTSCMQDRIFKIFTAKTNSSWVGRLIRFFNETKIHLVASSELFIQHCLWRHVYGHNSELCLQDIPLDVKVVVCLAEHDEIISTPKIERALESHNSKVSRDACSGAFVEKIVWRDVGHAHCVTNPDRWSDVHHAIIKVESQILEQDAHQKCRWILGCCAPCYSYF